MTVKLFIYYLSRTQFKTLLLIWTVWLTHHCAFNDFFFPSNRCANLIQYRLQCIEAVISARSETEEKIREASNWIENIETELKKLSKKSGIDVTDEERVLEKFEVSF